ncbi:MAG: aminotransferase class III-fold pyridoxal phosphate-dependent enzyme [Verrucomicrobia bacterium]|nr:aminotransferase class III-fold pyridoxal phosphate-dependent enzyme [Verrucomicrobiota bacterium]
MLHSPNPFVPVTASLADLAGAPYAEAVAQARAALTGEPIAPLLALAHQAVEFLPAAFLARQHQLLDRIGRPLAPALPGASASGAPTRMFHAASQPALAPLSALGVVRVGEDGRAFFIAKSEHYHTPLGHGFPGYTLLDHARRLGIPNATHNNTRGHLTRRLEEELVAAANGFDPADSAALGALRDRAEPGLCNRVLNLETGSLAVEAALKMILARFHCLDPASPVPPYAGRGPVLLVMGDDAGAPTGNYHGTTVLAQTLRGMWPDFAAAAGQSGLYRIRPIRPNCTADLDAAFASVDDGRHRIAGFFHEIVMMNYGARLLRPEFLRHAYELCRRHDVPVVADEIQSCLWHHEFFLHREYGLTPSFIAVGKGFPGGEYPASRLIFSAAYDCLPQFGALVTNGQEELASLAYLVTMRWARANAAVTRALGDLYEARLRELAARQADQIAAVEGRRHLAALCFHSLATAKAFVRRLLARGLDVSAQTYKADCPPAVLTKLPLLTTAPMIDFVLAQLRAALREETTTDV